MGVAMTVDICEIVEDIRNGTAVVVSDDSIKEDFGTAL